MTDGIEPSACIKEIFEILGKNLIIQVRILIISNICQKSEELTYLC